MAIILDADVIIRGEKGASTCATGSHPRRRSDSRLLQHVAELWRGVERATGAQKTRREQYLRSVLRYCPVLAYTEGTACFHARIWAELQRIGKMIVITT